MNESIDDSDVNYPHCRATQINTSRKHFVTLSQDEDRSYCYPDFARPHDLAFANGKLCSLPKDRKQLDGWTLQLQSWIGAWVPGRTERI